MFLLLHVYVCPNPVSDVQI